jgi:hypothetical protein
MTSHTGAAALNTELDLAAAAAVPPEEVRQRLGSSDSGLSGAAAVDRLKRYGPNVVGLHRSVPSPCAGARSGTRYCSCCWWRPTSTEP